MITLAASVDNPRSIGLTLLAIFVIVALAAIFDGKK